MSSLSRRHFLQGSLATTACLAASSKRVLGANNDIRIACIGVNGKGASHIANFERLPGVRVVAVCDVDPAILHLRVNESATRQRLKISAYTDVRRVIERNDIDAIAVATPNHWHALMGIWACQAGKDAYIEKPISHNIWEGRQLIHAAKRYGRIIAGGTQGRSKVGIQQAIAYIHSEELGPIKYIRALCYKARRSIGRFRRGVIPTGFDYNLWTGPAPLQPLTRRNIHFDWHWFYETGNGELGQQGIHQMDIARWALAIDDHAPRVMSIAGRFGYEDDAQTPNTQVTIHDYDKAPIIFESRGLPKSKHFRGRAWASNMDSPHGFNGKRAVGVIVQCANGKVVINTGDGGAAYDKQNKKIKSFSGGGNEYKNFISAVRSRKASGLDTPCQQAHISTSLCHTAMISHRLGKSVSDNHILRNIKQNTLASDRYEDMRRHLIKNGIDPTSPSTTLGPWLNFDPTAERFVGNDAKIENAANKLLTRQYRKPFIVPDLSPMAHKPQQLDVHVETRFLRKNLKCV